MFKVKVNSEILKKAINSVLILVEEAKLKFDSDGIYIKAVDPANISMVSVELNKDSFELYEADNGELGLDLKKMKNVLATANKKDEIGLELDEDTHKLNINMNEIKYTMSLLDPSAMEKYPEPPSLNFPAKIVINGKDFEHSVKAAEKVDDYIIMGIKDDVFFMEAEGDTDKVVIEFTKDKIIEIQPDNVSSMFSIDYLLNICKIVGKLDIIDIELGNNYPLKISTNINGENTSLSYILAPRVEPE